MNDNNRTMPDVKASDDQSTTPTTPTQQPAGQENKPRPEATTPNK